MWKCAQDGGFKPDLASIDQRRRILLMVTKDAAMSFSQFGYPYNATSQVSQKKKCNLAYYCSKDLTMVNYGIPSYYLQFTFWVQYNMGGFMSCTSINSIVFRNMCCVVCVILGTLLNLNYEWTHVLLWGDKTLCTLPLRCNYRETRLLPLLYSVR